jgi:hypothetical protein
MQQEKSSDFLKKADFGRKTAFHGRIPHIE